MSSGIFRYTNGKLVSVGDLVGFDELDGRGVIKRGRVEKILVPDTKEAKQWECTDGGVLIVFEDQDFQMWENPDEHLVPLE